uniref:Uncharacterized protein n=1 Tax=Arundo donax TaxID=35708 RepID=A0A0A8Z380_ARUDO
MSTPRLGAEVGAGDR